MRTKVVILAQFIIMASWMALWVPPWEPPDEPSHLMYVNYVAQNGSLPNQYVASERVDGEGHQPPLYYVLAALVNRIFQPGRVLNPKRQCMGLITSAQLQSGTGPCYVTDYRVDINLIRNPKHIWNGGTEWNVPVYKHLSKDAFVTQRDMSNFYALRLLSVAINVLNLWYMFRVARLFLHEPEWTPCPVLLVVTLPQFLFMSAAIENDDLAYLLATLTIYYALQILESPESVRNFLAVGLSLGLGLLTKKTLLFTVPVVALIVAYAAYNHRPAPGRVLRYGLLLFGLAMLISSFFFIRNYHLYGEFLGTRMEKNTLNELLEEKSLLSPYFWSYFPRELFFSYVGLFGYMNAPLPKAAYMGYALFIALCGIGLCLYLVQRARQGRKGLPEERLHNVRLAFAFLFILACFSGIVLYNLTYSMPQGRFLFPVISLITVLLTLGLKTIVVRIRPAWGRLALAAFIAVGLFALDVLSLAVLYRFYYVAAQYGA